MSKININEKIPIPEGITAKIVESLLTITGPKGEISREIYASGIKLSVEETFIVLVSPKATQREKKLLFTFKSHIKNMLEGVKNGYVYKLKICSGHFPMTVAVKNDKFEIKNFIGEKVPRKLTIKPGAEVKIEGDIITVTGINKEIVGQVAADIETLTKRQGFDKRIFQDGVYITEKAGKAM